MALLASLVACSDTTLNSPHPAGEDSQKIIAYSSFSERPKHLDPVRSYSADEGVFIDQIYDPPLQYHYLKRPYELVPNTLTAMPEVVYSDINGNPVAEDSPELVYSTYVLTLKPGTYYQPHPAFATQASSEQGEDTQPRYRFASAADSAAFKTLDDFTESDTRELVAADYVYQLKRLADPANLSPIRGLLAEYIVGMNEFAEQVTAARKQLADEPRYQQTRWLNLDNYDFSGVKLLDKYRYSIQLKGKYPQFRYWLAMRFLAPVPELVDEFYHQPGLADRNITLDWHPVGSGPFMMTLNDPNEAIVLQRNPNYRDDFYPTEGEPGDAEAGLLDDAGKRLPMIDEVIFRLEKESIPLWTKFLQGYYDRSGISSDSFDQAVSIGTTGVDLSDELKQLGIKLNVEVLPVTYYFGFNMLDPIVGGQPLPDSDQPADPVAQEKARKLRQAIAIAYNEEERISIFLNGRGETAQSPIPPGIFGYQQGQDGINSYVFDWDPNIRQEGASEPGAPVRKSIEVARQLLAEAGYPDGRDAQTGEPLVLNLDTPTGGGAASAQQIWLIKQFKKLGIQLNIRGSDYNRFKEKMVTGNAQMFQWGWSADYPDAENFLFLLYSKNGQVVTGGAGVNSSNYHNPEYDRLFEQMKLMPDSPERLAIIKRMIAIYQHDAPWASGLHLHSYVLDNPWVKNTKPHGISAATLKYRKIDTDMRAELREQRNQPVLWPLILVALVILVLMIPGYRAYRQRQNYRVMDAFKRSSGAPANSSQTTDSNGGQG